MIVSLCLGIIVCLPIILVGITKSRKSALEMWNYNPLISYSIIPSRHEKCIKSMIENYV
jgi:hypothetical protein